MKRKTSRNWRPLFFPIERMLIGLSSNAFVFPVTLEFSADPFS